MQIKVWLVFSVLFLLFTTPSVNAQEISPTVKKNVVKNFKADFSQYLPAGTSNCDLKPKGDANCDGKINKFDLSVWEVEFKADENPKRSDFNNDGFVNLLDFGIWRNTFYPPKLTGLNLLIQKVAELFGREAFAQTASNSPQVNSSNTFTGSSGNSVVTNNLSNGNTQQVNFNNNAAILSSQIFSNNGLLIAGVLFLDSGGAVITTAQDGISIQVSKVSSGAVFETFKNPDGTLITLKSWPNQESYDRSDPPLSVTLPGRDNKTLLTLNIQPNGSGILNETDLNGKLLNQRRLLGNGLYTAIDARSGSVTQTLNAVGLVNLSMPNKLGGQTTYYFINNNLTIINQTDAKGNFYSAIPASGGQQWELLSIVNNQESKKVVDNPISAIGSNTPKPSEIISKWNYYSTAAKTQSPAVGFGDSFNSGTGAVSTPVGKADQVYSIALVPPQVLGIVKEVKAQAPVTDQSTSQVKDGVAVQVTEFTGSNGQTNMTVSVFGPGDTGAAQVQTGTSQVTFSSPADVPDVSNMSPSQALAAAEAAAAQGNAQPSQFAPAGTVSLDALSSSVPADTGQAPPPVAAPPADVAPPPAAAPPANVEPVDQAPPPPPTTPAGNTPAEPETFTAGQHSVPDGFDPAGGVIGGVSFEHSFDEATNQISATFENGSTQVSNLNDGTVSFTYGAGTSYEGVTVDIGPSGNVESFTVNDTTYSVQNHTVTSPEGEVTNNDEGIMGLAESLVSVNDAANDDRPDQGWCFLPGTLISTPLGGIPIEQLKPGDKIYSFNETTNKKEASDFKGLDVNFVDEYLIINNKIKTTTYHPFYTNSSGKFVLKKAGELNIGDLLVDEEGNSEAVISIQKIEEPVTVYNLLDVSPNNNFYAENLLVHNYTDEVTGGGDPDAVDNTSFASIMDSANSFADIANSVADAVGSAGDWSSDWGGTDDTTTDDSSPATDDSTAPSDDSSPATDDSSATTDDSSSSTEDGSSSEGGEE